MRCNNTTAGTQEEFQSSEAEGGNELSAEEERKTKRKKY